MKKYAIIIFISISISLLSIEAILHTTTKTNDAFDNSWGNVKDQHLYYRHKPNSKGPGGDGANYYNSFGFRSEEIDKDKSENTIRIFCIGGSTTYGANVNNDSTYPYILQDLLNSERLSSKKIEVQNSGVCGYLSDHSLYRIKNELLSFKPDIFIIMDGCNDINTSLVPSNVALATRKPFVSKSRHSKVLDWLKDNTKIGELVFNSYKRILERLDIPRYTEDETREAIQYSLDLYAKNMKEIQEICQKEGILFIIVNHPWIFDFRFGPPDNYTEIKKYFSINIDDFNTLWIGAKMLNEINTSLLNSGIKVINPQADFDNVKDKRLVFSGNDYIHYNKSGNLLLASSINRTLAREYFNSQENSINLIDTVIRYTLY